MNSVVAFVDGEQCPPFASVRVAQTAQVRLDRQSVMAGTAYLANDPAFPSPSHPERDIAGGF
jgi:hypothetical protein